MKLWWKLGPKPRGRWRPKLEFGIFLSEEERKMAEELNVCLSLKVAVLWETENLPEEMQDRCAIPCKAERPYRASRAGQNDHIGNWDNNKRAYIAYWDLVLGEVEKSSISFYLPWRPGRRPDYSDYLELAKSLLNLMKEMIESRFQVAYESEELVEDQWEDNSFLILSSSEEKVASASKQQTRKKRKIMV